MKLLYTAGTARGGTNYRTLILNNHSKISMSIDPFIPLFHFYKKSLLIRNDQKDLLKNSFSNVIDDYYFDRTKLSIMKAIQCADPDIPFDLSKKEELKAKMISRMSLASANLIPHIDKIFAPTFKEVFYNIINLLDSLTKKNLEWVGFNDNWTLEFFSLIAKLFPEAKFIIHLRDPRAVIFSSEFAEPDPAKRPTIMSFARHLRKYMAFTNYFKNSELFKNRLLVTHYEPFIKNPEKEVKKVLEFLGLNYESKIIDVGLFRKANGEMWPTSKEIYKTSSNIWEKDMPKEMAELTEFICSPDMNLFRYYPKYYKESKGLSEKTYQYALNNFESCIGWRTDFKEFSKTIGSEFNRKRILKSSYNFSKNEIEQNFLFLQIYKSIKNLKNE